MFKVSLGFKMILQSIIATLLLLVVAPASYFLYKVSDWLSCFSPETIAAGIAIILLVLSII